MTEYFYTDGKEKFGPFSLEELKAKNISKETMVWFENIKEWTPAGNVDELSSIFSATPPPVSATPPPTPPQTPPAFQQNTGFNAQNAPLVPPKTWLVESILVTVMCCMPFGVVGIINATKVESKFYAKDYAGAQKASDDAGKWVKWGAGLGFGVLLLYFLFMMITVASGAF